MRKTFTHLVHDLYVLLEWKPPAFSAAPDAPLFVHARLDGIDFVLAQDDADTALISIYCNFGALPEGNLDPILLRLLEINLALARTNAGTLGIDAQTREVMFIFKASLRSLSAQSLYSALLHAAGQAKAWQLNRFTAADAAQAVPSQALASLA